MVLKRWAKKGSMQDEGDHSPEIITFLAIFVLITGAILAFVINQVVFDEQGYYAKDGAMIVNTLSGSNGPVSINYSLDLRGFASYTASNMFGVYDSSYGRDIRALSSSTYPYASMNGIKIRHEKLSENNYYSFGGGIVFSSADHFNEDQYSCPTFPTKKEKPILVSYCKYQEELKVDAGLCRILEFAYEQTRNKMGGHYRLRKEGMSELSDKKIVEFLSNNNYDIFLVLNSVEDKKIYTVIRYPDSFENSKLACLIANNFADKTNTAVIMKEDKVLSASRGNAVLIEIHSPNPSEFLGSPRENKDMGEFISRALLEFYGLEKDE